MYKSRSQHAVHTTQHGSWPLTTFTKQIMYMHCSPNAVVYMYCLYLVVCATHIILIGACWFHFCFHAAFTSHQQNHLQLFNSDHIQLKAVVEPSTPEHQSQSLRHVIHKGTQSSSVWLCEEKATRPGQRQVGACLKCPQSMKWAWKCFVWWRQSYGVRD